MRLVLKNALSQKKNAAILKSFAKTNTRLILYFPKGKYNYCIMF